MKSASDGPRVLVAGAGFAGLSTMSRLARGGFRVTLADRHTYSTFQPLLYQVATAGLAPSDVAYPLRGFAHNYGARFRHGTWPAWTPPPGWRNSRTAAGSSTTT